MASRRLEPDREAAAETPPAAESRRVEELLRINAGLAAELRRLTLDRTERPRSGQMPAARRLSVLLAERDALLAELEALRSHRDELERDNRILAAELQRLRSGVRGLLRRARARLGRAA
jgi:hypothetical protein